jgi:hypothetical protein
VALAANQVIAGNSKRLSWQTSGIDTRNFLEKLIVVSAAERAASYFGRAVQLVKVWRLETRIHASGGIQSWGSCSKRPQQDQLARSTWRSRTMAKQLEKSQWRAYFDRMSKALVGKRAEIEVASLKLGDQIEAEWLPLLGISYDPKDDIIEIALEGVDHLIPKPREVYVEENGLELSSLEVIDAEGTHQIIVLKDPMMLPAPAQSTAKAS